MLHASIVEKTMATPLPESDAQAARVPRKGLGYLALGAVLSSVLGFFIFILGFLGKCSEHMAVLGSAIFSILGMALSLICLIAAFMVGRKYSREAMGKIASGIIKPPLIGLPSFFCWALGFGLGGDEGLSKFFGFLLGTSVVLILPTIIGGIWVTSLGYTEKEKDLSVTPKK
jgi:hypothetical protein